MVDGVIAALINFQHIYNKKLSSIYHKVSNIKHTLTGYKIIDHSDVVGTSPIGTAPTTSSFST